MLLTLIKNELIKIFSRSKTWIVFGMFTILVAGLAFMNYREAKYSEYYYSPQGQIENLKDQQDYNNKRLGELNGSSETWAEDERKSLELDNEKIDSEIQKQKKLLDNIDDSELWKETLKSEKEELQQLLNEGNLSENNRKSYEEKLKEIDGFLDSNKKPVQSWEFDAVNFGGSLIQILGIVILVAGISVFMSDIVSGESTPPTLKFLLVQPISRGKVILSKFTAVFITVVGLIGGLELLVFGIVGAIAGFGGAEMPAKLGVKYFWDYNNMDASGLPTLSQVSSSGIASTKGAVLLQGFGLQVLFIIACCAFVFCISAIFKSSMTTMALSVIISVAVTMSCMISKSLSKISHLIFLNYGQTVNVITGDIVRNFNNPNFSISLGVTLMFITIAVSYIIAHVVFSKKDILI